jgi:MerR family transcriptional regulator/heat shock protein HspR
MAAKQSRPIDTETAAKQIRPIDTETAAKQSRPIDTARALYVISVAAELAGMHPQTLRIYERKGLIEPARTSGRSRRYSERDIELLRRIHELSNEGISLAGVQRVLTLQDELANARSRIAELEARVEAMREEIEARVEGVHREYRRELVPLRSATVMRFETRR